MPFFVSVIIPTYNVEQFIEAAIVSAVQQPEVNEVIVVDDGSSDNTLQIIKTLQVSSAKIKIYHHENNANKGRSATRNLGIKNSSEDYIAFLDADDFYLPNRFTNDKKVFQQDVKCEGVYNAVGFHFYRALNPLEEGTFKLSTVSQKIKSEDLFDAVISSKYGYLHLDGLTVKRSVFDRIGYFNELLPVAEDSDIIYKMALNCCLESGIIDIPLAKRGIHETNIFNQEAIYKIYNIKLYESIISWSCKNGILIQHIDSTLNWLWVFKFRENNSLITDTLYWSKLFFTNPKISFTYLSVKYFPIIRQRQILFPFLYQKN
ncbi:MAG: glycosyltransferase family 2 protein [Flavobacterium sp.]|uniref:glycosyltransferase family 2 protein n=1 Tax=Flavobacterium sp. TaxID=239 RepID=UPI0027362EF6|nr:glycosyltransferase family 2 protein [Flavobacterium sp.]MDP3679644.1 glycosyltransferase family 2 protein [Flavobacterium sp.]